LERAAEKQPARRIYQGTPLTAVSARSRGGSGLRCALNQTVGTPSDWMNLVIGSTGRG
jgi:hypothetical protein